LVSCLVPKGAQGRSLLRIILLKQRGSRGGQTWWRAYNSEEERQKKRTPGKTQKGKGIPGELRMGIDGQRRPGAGI